MKIATWNINSIVARRDFLLDFLRTRSPDFVLLQELKLADELFPRTEIAEAGYSVLLHGQAQWNGVAVLARTETLGGVELELVRAGLTGQESLGSRVVTVKAMGLTITSVYVPNGKTVKHPDFALKLDWLDALVGQIRETCDPEGNVIIGGDFNLCPGDLDSWDPEGLRGHIFHTDGERDRWKRLIDLGYFDLYREREPETRMFSWWDYRAGCFHKNQGLRIDFLIGSRSVLERTSKVWIDRDFRKKREGLIPSDHAPVIAEIDWPAVGG